MSTLAPPNAEAAAETLRDCLVRADPARGERAAVAADAALQARELAVALARPLDEARAAAWHCVHLLNQGHHAEALRQGSAALPLLLAPELMGERREVLRVMTLAGSEAGAFDLALDAAHELVRLTAPLGEDGPALSAAFTLAACFERMGDSWHAVRLLSQALRDHGGGAPALPLLMASNGLCAISVGIMHRLQDADAEGELQEVLHRARGAGEQARAMLAQVPDPVYEVAVLGNLGEVLMYQGELEAAGPLLTHAHGQAVLRGLRAHGWRVQASLGVWLLKLGRASEALASMRRLQAEMGTGAPQQTTIRSHHAAYLACRALGRHAEALTHFEIVERTERRRVTAQLRAQSQLFVTRTEAQHAQWLAEQARLDAQAQRERAAAFAASAERDPLTGLGNRRHLQRRCAELLPAAESEGRPVALVQIDIDHFKAVNDTHGHAMGDRVLVALSQRLRENTRSSDVLVRQGGEEFVVVLPGMTTDHAAEVCERLRLRVAAGEPALAGLPPLPAVTISIGLASAPPYDAAVLLQRADEALYRAKRAGRNRLALA